MNKINEKQLDIIWEKLKQNPSMTLYLEEVCEILHLSLKDESDIIFGVLRDDVFFEHDDNAVSISGLNHKFTWKINQEGFRTLSNYALHREQFLMMFHKLFYSEFSQKSRDFRVIGG